MDNVLLRGAIRRRLAKFRTPRFEAVRLTKRLIVTLEHRLKRRSDLNFRAVDDETVILDRASGLIHQLNPTASYLWDQCDGSSTTESIVERFARAFEIEPASAERDAIKVLSEMKQLNLLEVVQ